MDDDVARWSAWRRGILPLPVAVPMAAVYGDVP